MLATESPIHARDRERLRTLATDTLGETVKEFQHRYPKAICGTAASARTKPQNLTSEEIADKLYCDLDDRDSVARISPPLFFKFGVRAVTAIFWKSRLYDLGFDLNARSIRTVLGPFEKIYGPPALIAMDDPADPWKLTYVDWMEGNTRLHIWLFPLGGEVGERVSTHPKVQLGIEIVCVSFLNLDLAPKRR